MRWSFLRDAYSTMELPLSLNLVYKCFVLYLLYTFSSMDLEVQINCYRHCDMDYICNALCIEN